MATEFLSKHSAKLSCSCQLCAEFLAGACRQLLLRATRQSGTHTWLGVTCRWKYTHSPWLTFLSKPATLGATNNQFNDVALFYFISVWKTWGTDCITWCRWTHTTAKNNILKISPLWSVYTATCWLQKKMTFTKLTRHPGSSVINPCNCIPDGNFKMNNTLYPKISHIREGE